MATTRFHKAAGEGRLEPLREATKREINAKDEDGMTPVLWAAANGHLDALRLLVGRGGDVEKADYHLGRTALHLAAKGGHLNCVSFLVGFEANLWALDHDSRTPIQLATSREVLDFLDKAATKQTINNKKDVKAKKEKAIKDAERRRKKYEERLKKERDKEEKRIKKEIGSRIESDIPIPTVPSSELKKTVVEVSGPTFTQIVGAGTMTKKPVTGVKKILEKKLSRTDAKGADMKGSQNSLRRDSQIIYVNSYESQNNGKRGRIADVFETGKGEGGTLRPGEASIFDRPGFGSVAFRQRSNLAGTLSGCPEVEDEEDGDGGGAGSEGSSIGSAGSFVKRSSGGGRRGGGIAPTLPAQQAYHDDITTSDEENVVSNGQWGPLERFLSSAGVEEFSPQLKAQMIDLEALLMLNDQDLIQLGVPMGPRRKLLHAVEQRKQALKNPGHLLDSKL